MARPAVPQADKKSVTLTFRLTEKEMDKLVSLSDTCGKPLRLLIREKLFNGQFPKPKTAKLDLDTYLELKKTGVNLNQLTRQVNQGNLPPELLNTLNKLHQQQATIIQILLYDRQPENR